MSALTIALTAPGAHAQSASIRVSATVVRAPVRPAALDTAILQAAQAAVQKARPAELPGGVQVRRVERSAAVREVRVEFVAN